MNMLSGLKGGASKPQQAKPAYNAMQIAWELEGTAMGFGYYGNALRVAKDIPGLTAEDRSLLDRFATGLNHKTDHIGLQDLAMRVRNINQATGV